MGTARTRERRRRMTAASDNVAVYHHIAGPWVAGWIAVITTTIVSNGVERFAIREDAPMFPAPSSSAARKLAMDWLATREAFAADRGRAAG